jgi:CheY-like chemotaxis protein
MSLSILLVDDSGVNLRVASHMLKKLGHQADTATNGIEAIEALEHHSYDIVFMDIQMPEMDGLEATKTIRQMGFQDPTIIVLTSLNNYRETCIDAGADDYLTKPLGIETLSEAIKSHMPISSIMS